MHQVNARLVLALALVLAAHLPADRCDAVAMPVVLAVDPLYQTDYTTKLDNSNDTIAEFGCTLTAMTMEINFYLKKAGIMTLDAMGNKVPLQYTPEDINKLLNDYRFDDRNKTKGPDGKYGKTKRNGWGVEIDAMGNPVGSSTTINIGALRSAVVKDTKMRDCMGVGLATDGFYSPGFIGPPEFTDGTCITLDENFLWILDNLEAGRPVTVRVAGDTHSVLITSFHQYDGFPRGVGEYDIKDPFKNSDGTSIIWLHDIAYKQMIYDYSAGAFKLAGQGLPLPPFSEPSESYIPPEFMFDPIENPDMLGPQVFWENTARVLAADVPEPGCLGLVAMAGLFAATKRRPRSGSAAAANATMSSA